jgi:hypothetical protein
MSYIDLGKYSYKAAKAIHNKYCLVASKDKPPRFFFLFKIICQ